MEQLPDPRSHLMQELLELESGACRNGKYPTTLWANIPPAGESPAGLNSTFLRGSSASRPEERRRARREEKPRRNRGAAEEEESSTLRDKQG